MDVAAGRLEILLHRATDGDLEHPEPVASEAFRSALAECPNGAYLATRLIAARIKSPRPEEALLALRLLDECMRRCDSAFRSEVDKFRFLNEMIKLVSPKYYGNRTPPAVRQKVLDLMRIWTVDFPAEAKIRDAYEMLKKQGVVKEGPPPAPTPPEPLPITPSRPKNDLDEIFEDKEKSKMLKKLLKSKDRNDLQAANRLIKTMVREGERRIEAVTRRVTQIQTIRNNIQLLDEMLDQYDRNTSSSEDLDLIKELAAECNRMRGTVFRLISERHPTQETLVEVMDVNHELDKVVRKYSLVILHRDFANTSLTFSNNTCDSLLDLITSNATSSSRHGDAGASGKNTDIQVLGDIFSSVQTSDNLDGPSPSQMPILKPITLIPQDNKSIENGKMSQSSSRGFDELNNLGQELLKSSLLESCKVNPQFTMNKTDKTPLNSIGKNDANISNNDKSLKSRHDKEPTSKMLDLDYLIEKSLKLEKNLGAQNSSSGDDPMVDISDSDENLLDTKSKPDQTRRSFSECVEARINNPLSNDTNTVNDKQDINKISAKPYDVKNLTDIEISLNDITPNKKPPIVIYEEADRITISIHYAKNKPRPDVSVFVISTISRCTDTISDFKFHPIVPENCKVRLLQPSGHTFPAFSPFLPPAAVTQIMLVARPYVDKHFILKFVISYMCQNDFLAEFGDVKDLEFDEV